MTHHTISSTSLENIKKTIDTATSSPTTIPGCVFIAINRTGEEILSHASGLRGLESGEKMNMESVFWIASCTKMIAGIACMQLVERGVVGLDDPDGVEKFCPELKDMKILKGFLEDGKPNLVEKKNRITLRMLLSHTAGFGYTFFNPEIRRFGFPAGINEFSGRFDDMTAPLLFEPGSKFNYGTNVDWAGVLVERATKMSLNDYCQQHIFAPLNIENISFFPSDYMKSHLAYMHQRYPDGRLIPREHILHAPLSTADPKTIFNSAGAGCFAQPREYVKIIAMLLNDGEAPGGGKRVLKRETVEEMFSNQIPDMPNFGREPIQSAISELTNPIPELYPQPHDQPQGWGLSFMLTIHEGATGRGKNTGWWAGLPNLFWWCDREKGVGGMIASQIVPFADPQVMGLWAQVESAIYQG
ncbi:beta-lactamase/transpeptidase-like protein [Tricladium varicosporioides]|nr:beta-lactamase/transpeptidase-like protein [Hymenoscyphus varicosporioides]